MKILRKIFKKKIKVTFYMKSGNSFLLKFKEFEILKLKEYKENTEKFTININQIEAIIIH